MKTKLVLTRIERLILFSDSKGRHPNGVGRKKARAPEAMDLPPLTAPHSHETN